MKKVKYTASILLAALPALMQAELYLVDQVDVVVCGPERNTPFVDTESTFKRNLDGKLIDLTQQMQQDIIGQQIFSEKMTIDPSAADKYIDTMKKQHNLTDSDLAELFAEVGRTLNEGLSLLSDQYYQELFMHFKFRSQVVALEEDIIDYYKNNPTYTEGTFDVQVASVSYDDTSKDSLKEKVEGVAQGKDVTGLELSWSPPMTIKQKDLVDDKKFLFDLELSQVALVDSLDSFELYKVLDKKDSKLMSIDDCRSSIVNQLDRQKFETMLHDYNNEVKKFIDVIKLNDSLEIE